MVVYSMMRPVLFLLLWFFSYHAPIMPEAPVSADKGYVWHDLVTPDIYGSGSFYEAVFGWKLRVVEGKGLRIGTFYNGSTPVAGVIEIPKANSAVWMKAVFVRDLKARVTMVKQRGGKEILPPSRIVGRGVQVVMEGASGEEFSFVESEGKLQTRTEGGENHWLWSELWSDDPESSGKFYSSVFGVSMEKKLSDNRPYWVFMADDLPLAGMIKNPVTNQGTQWVPYVQTSNPAVITSKAQAAGAFVVLEPTPEVRGGKVGVFQDPEGALICVQNKN